MQNCALSCATFGCYAIIKYTKIIIFVSCGYDQVNKTCNLNESLGHHVKSCLLQSPMGGCCIIERTKNTGSIHKYTLFSNLRDNLNLQPFCYKLYKAFLIEISPAYRHPYAIYFLLLICRCCTGLCFHHHIILWQTFFNQSHLTCLQCQALGTTGISKIYKVRQILFLNCSWRMSLSTLKSNLQHFSIQTCPLIIISPVVQIHRF